MNPRSAFGAGMAIGIGCLIYVVVSQTSQPLAAAMFSLGLFTVLAFGLPLFTGAVGGLVLQSRDNRLAHACMLTQMLALNLLGITAMCLICSGMGLERFAAPSCKLMQTKFAAFNQLAAWQDCVRLIGSSLLCGVLMQTAVSVFKRPGVNHVAAAGVVMICVMGFILTGSDHCIATTGYLALAAMADLPMGTTPVLYVLMSIIGNSIGSWLTALFIR